LELIREDIIRYDWGWSHGDITVPENVLTTKEQTLTVLFRSRSGEYEYGFKEFLQVYLDGMWYNSTLELSPNGERLLLNYPDRYDGTNNDATEYTVDLSVMGALPPGRYRFVEVFYDERFKEEIYAFANFWVIKPGEKRPPESETTGKARKEDINLYAQSLYEARREITDKDILFCMYVENLSGKKYCIDNGREPNPPVLELKQNGKWEKVDYQHVNAGLINGWRTDRNEFFLDEPLTAGRYRIRVLMYILYEPGNNIELEYEFDVLAYENAPEPKWDISRLLLSPYGNAEPSAGISMSLTYPVLNKDNTGLEIIIAAEKYYTFGEH